METSEILKKVRKIEIKSKGLSNQIFSGEYHSAFKGSGMAFSEVREYSPGDDIRKIDWNVTARFGAPFIKVFEEERELTVMFLIDLSASDLFGTKNSDKRELITELCAVLSFSALQNNDKVGVIIFSDVIEKFIPPKKGRSHVLRVIRELVDFQPQNQKTNITEALNFFNNVIKKKCTCFILSDFNDSNFQKALSIANRKHDLVAIWTRDPNEKELPSLGFIPIENPETKHIQWIDSSNASVQKAYKVEQLKREHQIKTDFKKSGVDFTELYTNKSYIQPLMTLFKMRGSKK